MTNHELALETFLRSAAISRGYQLIRSESGVSAAEGYVLLDTERQVTLLGGEARPFPVTLQQVESFLMDGPKLRQRHRAS